jgi:hypothetical protein
MVPGFRGTVGGRGLAFRAALGVGLGADPPPDTAMRAVFGVFEHCLILYRD